MKMLTRLSIGLCLTGSILLPAISNAATESVLDSSIGSFHISSRYRFEHVNDDRLSPTAQKLKNANASTLRTTLAYQSVQLHNFDLRLELEHVMPVGNRDFNDGSNGLSDRATVVDPSGIELDQAYVGYQYKSSTEFKVGRQYITYRNAPFHRFIGTVLWRQNWQTQDAISFSNKSFADTTINYAYTWKVNRIFGRDAPEPLSHFDSNSHLINLQYTGFAAGKLEAYAYLLDFDNASAFSTQTFGLRFDGKYKYNETLSALYAAEYAYQADYANNPSSINTDYLSVEIGGKYEFTNPQLSATLKFTYEKLAGDGGADRFVTILGTNHAFQGWADRFLVTPQDGIEDLIGTAVIKHGQTTLIVAYHQLGSDNLNYDYGNELDILLSRNFGKKITLGLKYSDYNADRNASSLARNGSNSGVTNDVNKFWLWGQLKF